MRRIAAFALLFYVAACTQPEPQPAAIDDAADNVATASAEPVKSDAEQSEQKPGPAPAVRPVAKTGSQCLAGEGVAFTCPMKSGKHVSVCITQSDGSKFAQYRFGPPDGPAELVWPAKPDSGRLSFASVPYSGGGEGQIIFTNGDTTYAVFSRIVRTHFVEGEPNYPAITDGIIVKRGGAVLGELLCMGDQAEMPVNFGLAKEYMDAAPELITGG